MKVHDGIQNREHFLIDWKSNLLYSVKKKAFFFFYLKVVDEHLIDFRLHSKSNVVIPFEAPGRNLCNKNVNNDLITSLHTP